MNYCTHCGIPMEKRYRPAGFDSFYGSRRYVKDERCPHARGWGWFSSHTIRGGRYPESADHFGFSDETIPTGWQGEASMVADR